MPSFVFSASENERPFQALVQGCQAAGATLGIAESLTGGMLGYLLIRQEGGGSVVAGSLVTYHTQVKQRLLGVSPGPVVSARAASEMAVGARQLLNCDLAVALTGVAGPETQDGMPVGTLFVGLADRLGPVEAVHYQLEGDPDRIRWNAAIAGCSLATRRLADLYPTLKPDGAS